MDQYLTALLAHNASQLPLAENARYTENGQDLEMDDGMWQVATAIGDKKLYFADVHSGQVGIRGVVEENGRKIEGPPFNAPFCFMIGELFKIKNRRITRIEAIVIEVPYGMPSGWAKPT